MAHLANVAKPFWELQLVLYLERGRSSAKRFTLSLSKISSFPPQKMMVCSPRWGMSLLTEYPPLLMKAMLAFFHPAALSLLHQYLELYSQTMHSYVDEDHPLKKY